MDFVGFSGGIWILGEDVGYDVDLGMTNAQIKKRGEFYSWDSTHMNNPWIALGEFNS